jgi:hypothetical protein
MQSSTMSHNNKEHRIHNRDCFVEIEYKEVEVTKVTG